MNVCLLTRFFDYKGTGVTRIATEVLHHLEKKGHRVFKVYTKGTSLYSYFAYTAMEIPFRLPRKHIDAYHALATLEAMWLPRKKSIATFLDLFTTTNPERAGAGMGYSKWKLEVGRRYFEVGSQLASRCALLTCISNKTKSDMIEYLHIPESKIRVIHLGIPSDLEPKPMPHNRFTIGTLGQLDKRKRIDLLIRQFKESKIDADLLIAGRGMDRPLLEDIANGDSRIKFLGLVDNGKLNDFYNLLDLFVFPTAIEGWGLPPVEAMACKKPVFIMSDAIIPFEVATKCVKIDNLTSVFNDRNHLDSLIQGVNYERNYEFAKQHDWDKCTEEYIKLYQEVQ